MNDKTFTASCVAVLILGSPVFCLGWLVIMNKINWHDAVMVSSVFATQYQIWRMGKRERSWDRAVRRATSRRLIREFAQPTDIEEAA